MDDDLPETSVWLRTERDDAERYSVTLSVGDDYARRLDRDAALTHAMGVLQVAQIADYSGAIMRQMGSLDIDTETAQALVADMMLPLAPSPAATEPLTLSPAINRVNGEPMMQIAFQGQKLGIWSLAQARGHAVGVLEAVFAAELDNRYSQVLADFVNLPVGVSTAVVHDVGQFRWSDDG